MSKTERLNRLREKMVQEKVDLVILAPGAHMAWLLDVKPHADERALLVIISCDHIGFLMPSLEADSARQQTDLPFYLWADDEGPDAALGRLLSEFHAQAARTIALDEAMRADHAALVQDHLSGANRQFSESTVGALRMRKDQGEYELLKRNAQSADIAMQAAWSSMRAGISELEVAEIARDSFNRQGANPLFTVVGAGSNGAFPHHQTGSSKLAVGDAVVMDIGAGMEGYSSDITRMALIGDAPDGYMPIHNIVNSAVEAALEAAKPGVPAHVVDSAARNVIEAAGYGEFFIHRTGHGLGTQVHEPPYITASSQTVLDEGMVFSIEPGIYLPDRFGLRLEEIVILQSDGPEILSELPRDAVMIG